MNDCTIQSDGSRVAITLSESYIASIHYSSCVSTHINPSEFIDSKIQAAVSDMKTKLSAMACTGCGGNINPQTLLCECCGRQYRLVSDT